MAMGTGTDIAANASGLVIMSGNLGDCLRAIRISKLTLRKIRQNLFWAFIYNTIGIPLAAFGFLNPIVAGTCMAFSSVSVVTQFAAAAPPQVLIRFIFSPSVCI